MPLEPQPEGSAAALTQPGLRAPLVSPGLRAPPVSQGLRVAIAGAGQGIGAACARLLARQGARLLLCARSAADVEALAAELRSGGAEAHSHAADVSTDAGAASFAQRAFAALGGLDAALLCTGEAHPACPLSEVTAGILARQFAQNAAGPTLAAGALLRSWGSGPVRAGASAVPEVPLPDRHILVLSSLATLRPPMPGAGPYTASKAALEALVRALAEECWPLARVNALCLGPVATRLHARAGTPSEWVAQLPGAGEVAPLLVSLLGPLGAGITGRALDAEALQADPAMTLGGAGRLAQLAPLQLPGADPEPEAEPGRRPSPRVRRALRGTASILQRYPEGSGALEARLAELHGVGLDQVALSGGGATELLERTLRAFCSPRDEVLSPFPTYEVLSALCAREGLRHRPVPAPRRPDGLFAPHAAAQLLAAVGPRTRLCYVASPDNPTGAELPPGEEAALLACLPRGVPLVIDEAWSLECPGSGAGPDALRLRSFSKLQGLAGLRIGYAVGPASIVAALRRLSLPFPLGAPQLAGAHAALDELPRARRSALLLARERARVAAGLRSLGLLVGDSRAPLLLVRDPGPRPRAGALLFALRAAGIPAQEAHWDPAALFLSLGPRAQNQRALAAAQRAIERAPAQPGVRIRE